MDFERTNKLLAKQLEQEKGAYNEVRQMVKQIKRDLAAVTKEKEFIRGHVLIQRKQMDRHRSEVDQKAVDLGKTRTKIRQKLSKSIN